MNIKWAIARKASGKPPFINADEAVELDVTWILGGKGHNNDELEVWRTLRRT